MAKPGESKMDERLRWMSENVRGAYNAKHTAGHIKDGGDDHCTNSGRAFMNPDDAWALLSCIGSPESFSNVLDLEI